MADSLQALMEAVSKRDSEPLWHFVGDYVNRGPQSKQVIDLLLALDNAKFCRGNHDDVLDLVVNNHCVAPEPAGSNRVLGAVWFMKHGMIQTFRSYGARQSDINDFLDEPSTELLNRLVEVIPNDHRSFIGQLPIYIEAATFVITHGWWDPNRDFSAEFVNSQAGQVRHGPLLWGRFELPQITREKPWTRPMFFGHTPVDAYRNIFGDSDLVAPFVGEQMVLVDTAAALSPQGQLTAYCADTDQWLQVDRELKLRESR